jgi:predicted DNA-binding transcriptional regulator AlpA
MRFRKRKKKEDISPLERITLQYRGFITIPELAFILRTSVQTVHNWAGRGRPEWRLDEFPQILVRGRRWMFIVQEVEDYFEIKIADRDRQFAQPLLSCKDIQQITGYGDSTVRGWMKEEGKRIGKVLLRIERKRLEEFLKDKYQRNLLEEYPKIHRIGV